MPFLKNATEVRINNSIFRDVAGSLYSHPGGGEPHKPIDLLNEYYVREAIYDFRNSALCPDTGIPLFKDLQNWMLESRIPVLLLSGPPGTGKSSIARHFAHICAMKGHYPVISFCFARHDDRLMDFHRVIPTLARQLYGGSTPGLTNAIVNAFEEDIFLFSRSLGKQFQQLVIQPIRESFLQGANPDLTYVILLDGLDTCDDHGIIKQFFSEIKPVIDDESFQSRIKIICTSRDVPSITTAFYSILDYYRHMHTGSYNIRNDIAIILRRSTQNLRPLLPNVAWNDVIGYIANNTSNIGHAIGILGRIQSTNIQSQNDIITIVQEYVTQPHEISSGITTQSNAHDNRNRFNASPLSILLSILGKRMPRDPINTLVTPVTIEFMVDLLIMRDYVMIHAQLKDDQETENLLEFITYALSNNLLHSPKLFDGNRRARRLMMKLGKERKIIPKSFYLNHNEITMNPEAIGTGGFSSVFKGSYRGNPVALKRFQKPGSEEACREALTWKTLSHANVLPLLGIYSDSINIMLVSPLMDNTLINWRKSNSIISEIEKRVMQVVEGVQYLHSEGVIHGDLRGNNVLLDSNEQVRISDFGLTRHSDATATSNYAMSYHFAAPELFPRDNSMEGQDELLKRTEMTDVYAFACLYYEVHYDRLPYLGMSHYNVGRQVMEGKRPPLLSEPPLRSDAWQLITKCWSQGPGDRPNIDDVLETMVSWSS